jgi:Bacterial antitoxin of type II TA system, VapB
MGIVVDSDLVARVVALSGERTIKAAVAKALEEFISHRKTPKQRELLNNSRVRVGPVVKKVRRRR